MTCPGFDDLTIVRKQYGQYGIDLDPNGGITLTSDGLSVFETNTQQMVSGTPTCTAGGDALSVADGRFIQASSKRQGQLVTFQIDCQGPFTYSGFTVVVGPIAFSLPYQSETVAKGHASGGALNFSTAWYRRNVFLNSTTKTQLVDQTFTVVENTVPFTFDSTDRFIIFGQYVCDASATYAWT